MPKKAPSAKHTPVPPSNALRRAAILRVARRRYATRAGAWFPARRYGTGS
ncbi:hypothetical protein ABIA38_001344 [Embleya sp. AB8]